MRIAELGMVVLLTLSSGCASFESYYRNDTGATSPKKIGIGYIDKRDIDLVPYVEKNLQDELSFELLKNDFEVKILYGTGFTSDSEKIAKILQDNNLDALMQGAIVQSVIGDAFSSQTNSMIAMKVYDRKGLLGEYKYYINEELNDINSIKKTSRKIINALYNDIERHKENKK